MKRVFPGYISPILTHYSAIYENLKDRDAGRLSFFMLCAICVQIEYYNMEIIDTVDIFIT